MYCLHSALQGRTPPGMGLTTVICWKFRCKHTYMMATGRTLGLLRHSTMPTWELLRSQYLTSGDICKQREREEEEGCWFRAFCSGYLLLLMWNLLWGSFYDRSAPIYTQARFLPPSKMLDADVMDSVIGEGCIIQVTPLIVVKDCIHLAVVLAHFAPTISITWLSPIVQHLLKAVYLVPRS